MKFREIEERWHSSISSVRQRDLWRDLTGSQRGWFKACQDAVRGFDDNTLKQWLEEKNKQAIIQSFAEIAASDARISLQRETRLKEDEKEAIIHFHRQHLVNLLCAHLRCALLAIPSEPLKWKMPDADELRSIAEETELPLGFLRDLNREMLTKEEKLKEQNGGLCGDLRPAEEVLPLTVLFVDEAQKEKPGVVATLTLELMPDGTRELYPVPALAFVYRDWEFRKAEDNARLYLKEHEKVWLKEWDVRWKLERRDGKPINGLSGPSLGGAFAFGLAKLLVIE